MIKRKFITTLLLMGVLGIGVYGLYQGDGQSIRAGQTDESQEEIGTNEVKEQKSKAREKVEKMTDEEMKELIYKGKEANKGNVEVTEEETDMLKAITPSEYYDLIGMTDEEVLAYISAYHQQIDERIMFIHQGKEEYNEYLSGKPEFEWIKENYDFEKEYYNESINEIVNLIDEFMEGNQDALFSLKYMLYELNEEFNPESLKEERANKVTLSNAVRIQNGQEPINEYD